MRFPSGRWREGEASLPVLVDALASIECEIAFTQTIGTHRMVVSSMRHVTYGDASRSRCALNSGDIGGGFLTGYQS